MDSNDLLDRLNELLPAELDEILFRLAIPTHLLSEGAPRATRAVEVLRYLGQKGSLGDLERLLGPATSLAPVLTRPAAPSRAPPAVLPAQPSAPSVLFLGADSSDQTRLALGREVREIGARLRESEGGRGIRLVQEWAARPTDLQAVLLRIRPDVVHFSGHGSPDGELSFEGDDGLSRPVPPDMLGRLVAILGGRVRCVVLNACYSEIQARVLAEHIDCVVGMQRAIHDGAAIAFAGSFYLALGHGESVQTAFALGRNQIELASLANPARDGHRDVGRPVSRHVRIRTGADLPVLIHRPGVDPGAIILVPRLADPG